MAKAGVHAAAHRAEQHHIIIMRRLTILLVAISLIPGRAFAWGSEGHRVIAEIAEQYLEPATAKQVRDLLAIENTTTL